MKQFKLLLILLVFCVGTAIGQTAYNPFTQNIHFVPEPVAAGFECGSTPSVKFTQGLTTAADATQWATDPLKVTICLGGFVFNGPASSVVSGSYASNFTWAYVIGSPNCIIGTQNQTLPGTGSNPIFPNPLSSGDIILALKVPENSPVGTVLSVNVTLQIPPYMQFFNSVPDDDESTQTQTFCNCYALTDPGTIGNNQSFCVSGDPAPFTTITAPSGGSGSVIIYQWEELISGTWTAISGATAASYDASTTTTNREYRRNAKRSACGTWLNSNSVTVTINSLPTVNAGVDKNLNCTTTSTTIGTAAVSGTTYTWSPATALSSSTVAQPTASPTVTTNYTVTATGSNGCTATDVVTVNVNTTPPTANAGVDKNLNCTTTSATIGTASISGNTYSWSPSTGLNSTSIAQPTANPTVTTTYTVTVTGSNGCTATDVVVVNVNTTLPTANAGPNQTTTCNTTSVTIGTAVVAGNTYVWSPAAGLSSTTVAQPVANPTANTTYTVTVTGANGCTATSSVTVTVNKTPPTADAGGDKNLNCTTTNTIIGTSAISGNTYSWLPATGLNSVIIAQPTANPSITTSYTVTVTGANGCTSTDVVVVNVNTTPPTVNAGPNQTTTCTTTTANIGTAAISGNTYSWSPAAGLSSTTVAQPTANPASTTTYTVTVTGANGCTATSTVTVTVNKTPPTADAGINKNLDCNTTSSVIGTTAISGNTYSWAPSTGLSSTIIAQPTASPAVTTAYTVTVTGANGCTATDIVLVNVNTTPPTATAGPNQTTTCTTTSVTIGTPAISGSSYSWSPSAGLSSSTVAQPIANPTASTTYTVTVTGANGCTATSFVTVTVNKTPPTADAGADKNLNCTTTSATIGTTAISGNTYAWSPATGLNSTTIAQPTANPTVTTTYTVTVTGANGCVSTDAVVVNVNTTPPTANAGPNQTTTCTTTSVTIGTTATASATFSWSPAAGLSSTTIAQPIANPAATTTYTVVVTGTNGCTATSTVTVTVNKTPPTADAGTDKNLNCTTTSAVIGTTAISGNTYAWSPSTGLNSTSMAQPTASPLVTTTYTVTVTGANGCTSTDAVVVNVNTTPPTVDAGPDRNLNCSFTSATIGTTAISGNTYSWSPTNGLSSASVAQPIANPLSTTTYTVTVTGANGCTATDVVVVNVNTTPPTVDAGPDRNLNCTTTSTTIGTPAISGNLYSWSPATGLSSTSAAQPTANPSVTTIYTLTVTGANGCIASDIVVVNVNTSAPVADAGVDKFLTCASPAANIGSPFISGNSYLWSPTTGLNSPVIALPIASPSVTTTYTVTVTGANGCTATDVVVVNVNNTIPTITITGVPEVCNGSTAAMTATANIGTITWSNGSSVATQNLTAGTYTVTANNSGCISTTTVTVTVREGSVGNYVWTDLNADGINNEPASSGINGVTVQLYSIGLDLTPGTLDDQLVGTTTTANNGGNPGYYKFVICNDGGYYVKFPLSTNANDTLTTQTATIATDNNSDANVLTGNSPVFNIVTNGSGVAKDNNTIDAGYLQSLSLGNAVWNDLNKNGIKEIGEPGILGATVYLYADVNNDGVPDGGPIATTTTNSNGLYIFNDLFPSNYIVGVTPPVVATGNPFTSSTQGQETNPNLNVDNNDNGISTIAGITYSGTITLLGGTEPTGETPNNGTSPDASSNLTVDFAFYQPVNISGNVFNDINGPSNVDGVGIGSASGTQLFATLVNPSGVVVAVVPVNPNGTYTFLDVLPSTTYTMVLSTIPGTVGNSAPAAVLPTGWSNVSEDCCDNTGNDGTTNGVTTVVVGTTDVQNVNFGIREPLSLGNAVWSDANKNGIKDASETGIDGATVNLYEDANNDGIPDGSPIATTTTNVSGNYVFNGLNPGNYIVGVTPPTVGGGTYSSSTVGEEANPNLNVDNNDNGIASYGAGETISGTVTLSAGNEPLGELPNNASAPDANANLTVDFGFFVCPSNFTFNPQLVCASSTINLLSLEPAGYTGGVWTTSTGATVPSTNVGAGTYNYTYTNGTCSATGSVTISLNIPDYTPTISIAPSAITGISNVRVIVTISEILNRAPCSDIYVFIPRLEPRFTFSYNTTATSIGGVSVSNGDWQYFTSNPNFYVWKYVGSSVFPAGGQSKFGYIGSYDPNSTDGETSFGVQIFQGSGGETNLSNNTDSEILIYFR